jgi:hypothetical protein
MALSDDIQKCIFSSEREGTKCFVVRLLPSMILQTRDKNTLITVASRPSVLNV